MKIRRLVFFVIYFPVAIFTVFVFPMVAGQACWVSSGIYDRIIALLFLVYSFLLKMFMAFILSCFSKSEFLGNEDGRGQFAYNLIFMSFADIMLFTFSLGLGQNYESDPPVIIILYILLVLLLSGLFNFISYRTAVSLFFRGKMRKFIQKFYFFCWSFYVCYCFQLAINLRPQTRNMLFLNL